MRHEDVSWQQVSDAYQTPGSVALPQAPEEFTQGHAAVNVAQTWEGRQVWMKSFVEVQFSWRYSTTLGRLSADSWRTAGFECQRMHILMRRQGPAKAIDNGKRVSEIDERWEIEASMRAGQGTK